MKRHLVNAAYGALDYVSYPFGMLAIAPIVLHKSGAAEYGLWMIATAVVSAGGIIASGFSDAGMQHIATLRGMNHTTQIGQMIRALFGINLALGCLVALSVWIGAPYAARHIAAAHVMPVSECLTSLRIASVIILMRAIEAVSATAQRAFEEYRHNVRISTASRLLTLASAAILSAFDMHIDRIMLATAAIFAGNTYLQFRSLKKLLGDILLRPAFRIREIRVLAVTGIFVWLQAVGSVIFRQLDRILLGLSLGAAAVAPYSISIQFAEPLFGLTASGFSFFFPYLSSRVSMSSSVGLRRSVLKAFAGNLLLVSVGTGVQLIFGARFLLVWAGPAVAHQASSVFPWIVLASACSGLSVTGTYALQALGQFRTVACISLGSRSAVLVLMLYLLHIRGLQGLAIARLCYGAAMLLVYVPMVRALGWAQKRNAVHKRTAVEELQEGAHL
ncbi:MAG TPA: oligosaccharide flippase family protein [Edaphobacter sp.]|nr:oligosaccharide flippase family protein [Edaphobacter sp.]